MKRTVSMLLVTAMLMMGLTACSGQTDNAAENTAAGDAEEFIIGCEYSTSSCVYCMNLANAIKEYGEAEGMTVLLTQANRDVYTEISNAESMLAQGAQVVGGIWDDSDACMPVATACAESDAWCVGLLNGLTDRADGYEKYAYVGSENYDGGYLQGEWLAENLPENAEIFYMACHDGDAQSLAREEGMLDALKDAGRDDVTVKARENTHNNRDEGLKVMENWLQAYDDIKCVVSCSDETALPAIEAMKAAGRFSDDVIVVGFDGSAEACESIAAGEMSMSVLQDYKAQAKAYIELCAEIRDGKEGGDKMVPFATVDESNVAEYENY